MLPTGIILMWSGAIGAIPAGWTLCDGTAGTPDLRDRFVVGAGDTYAVDANGGSINHNHDFTSDGHTHNLQVAATLNAGNNWDDITTEETDTGTTDNGSSLPPYHALAFIMKT